MMKVKIYETLAPIWKAYHEDTCSSAPSMRLAIYDKYVAKFTAAIDDLLLIYKTPALNNLLEYLCEVDLPPYDALDLHAQGLKEYIDAYFNEDEDIQRMGF